MVSIEFPFVCESILNLPVSARNRNHTEKTANLLSFGFRFGIDTPASARADWCCQGSKFHSRSLQQEIHVDGVIRKYNATLLSLLQYAYPKQNMNIAVNRADVASCPTC
jgi:hypothetical protein